MSQTQTKGLLNEDEAIKRIIIINSKIKNDGLNKEAWHHKLTIQTAQKLKTIGDVKSTNKLSYLSDIQNITEAIFLLEEYLNDKNTEN